MSDADAAGLRLLWATNEGAARITANSILTLLAVAPDLTDAVNVAYIDQASAETIARHVPAARLMDLSSEKAHRIGGMNLAPGAYSDYGSARFGQATAARYIGLKMLFAERASPVLYSDGDIGFLRDPRPYFAQLAATFGTQILMQNDRHIKGMKHGDASDEPPPGERPGKSSYCTGFVYWPEAASANDVADQILAALSNPERAPDLHDQTVFNAIPPEQRAVVQLLRQDLFCNGSLHFTKSGRLRVSSWLAPRRLASAIMLHANWMVGMDAKIRALKAAGLWMLEP